jgi:hypothetical protein
VAPYKEIKLVEEEIQEDKEFDEIDKQMKERSEIDCSKCKGRD